MAPSYSCRGISLDKIINEGSIHIIPHISLYRDLASYYSISVAPRSAEMHIINQPET